jgi:hypothetical protein
MGSLDWLTTVVGIVWFGALESNPILAPLSTTNLPAFTAIKLGTAVFVGLLFLQAEKISAKTAEQDGETGNRARIILKIAYAASLVFLVIAVLNNIWLIAAVHRI